MTKRGTASTHTKNDVTYLLTGEETYVCDFSALQTEGEYQIHIPGVGYSHKFRIGQAALGKAFWTHCRGLFHHRSGCSGVVKPYTNWEYPKPAHAWTWESNFICDDGTYDLCVTPDGTTYPTLFSNKHFSMIPNNATGHLFRDLRGGWYDAADFDRRPYHFGCVRDLVEVYLRFPQNFTDSQLDLPESGDGIPDILSEAEWGLDVWRRGQHGDGGIAAWIEADGHESDWPWLSEKKYYIGLANRKDSLEYAQCAAKFARALRIAGTPAALAKADVYTESAIRAFNFGIDPGNAATLEFTQKNSANAGFDFSYAEPDGPAKCLIAPAAAALFALTGEPRFAREITSENFEAHYAWIRDDANDFAQNCATEFLFDLDANFPEYATRMKSFILGKADLWRSYQELQPCFEMTWPPDHAFYTYVSWGVGHPERRGKAYIYAWLLTGDAKYRDSALLAMDNVAGCNVMGRCITTGLGKVSPVHHLDSWLPRAEHELKVYEPVPGITPYTFIGDLTGKATPYGFCLYKSARTDMNFAELTKNILPGGLTSSVPNTRANVAVWLQQHWPLWRHVFEMEGQIVAQSEFTVSETVSGKAFMAGCLMGVGFTPDPAWNEKTPSSDKYAVEGLVYLP
ncbi:MAG: Endoglucanase D precursor [Lentisphaerae bacterium ADurb.Bin242]|nr:MAG: Endoglucanase D precursor [Lentisphaerae bacterium ADurb.Bin242]